MLKDFKERISNEDKHKLKCELKILIKILVTLHNYEDYFNMFRIIKRIELIIKEITPNEN